MNFISNFNRNLYMKIRGVREERGLPVRKMGDILTEHPLIGMKIKDLENDRILTIDKVVKNWYHGYYLTIHPVDENRSHASIFWENISSVDKNIIEGIEEAHYAWKLM